jgi:phage shock protein A
MRLILCLGICALLGGCDSSKEELQSTKSTLEMVTKERDDLKGQLTQVQQKLDATKAELDKAKAAPATATAAAKPPADAKTATPPAAKAKHKS